MLNHLYWNKYFERDGLPRSAADFAGRLQAGRAEMVKFYSDYETNLVASLEQRFVIVNRLDALTSPAYVACVADVSQQLEDLFGSGYPESVPWDRFQATPGYLRGISYRLEHLQGRVSKDGVAMAKLGDARTRLVRVHEALSTSAGQGASTLDLEALWIAYEEWRLALFAQPLALHNGMSDKKFRKRLETVETRLGLM